MFVIRLYSTLGDLDCFEVESIDQIIWSSSQTYLSSKAGVFEASIGEARS